MLILSIPFLDPEFVKKHAAESRFEWQEYRLDYHENLHDFPLEILDDKSIVTIRNISEGGRNDFPIQEKIDFYQTAIQRSNCLIDLEIQQYEEGLINPENLILTHHDFSETFDVQKLKKIIQEMNQTSARFVKIAISINSYQQLLTIQDLIKNSNKPVIFAGMGKLGRISRLLHKHLGAEGTFIGLNDHQTALGQLTENDLEIYNLDSLTADSKIGGIVGGIQVFDSLGLGFYNDYFQQNDLDAVYLPFAVENLADFLKWINTCHFKNKFYGFSVTMPFKQKFTSDGEAYNLFLPRKNRYLNTDQDAYKAAIKFLEIAKNERILVFGSGGSAQSALRELAGFPNVFVCARSALNLPKYISPVEAGNQSFDLLINCTPIGMKGEDFSAETGIVNFGKVIDLPYRQKDTKLVEFCKNHEIPFVDGRQFWQWQAERQLEEFTNEIKRIVFPR